MVITQLMMMLCRLLLETRVSVGCLCENIGRVPQRAELTPVGWHISASCRAAIAARHLGIRVDARSGISMIRPKRLLHVRLGLGWACSMIVVQGFATTIPQ